MMGGFPFPFSPGCSCEPTGTDPALYTRSAVITDDRAIMKHAELKAEQDKFEALERESADLYKRYVEPLKRRQRTAGLKAEALKSELFGLLEELHPHVFTDSKDEAGTGFRVHEGRLYYVAWDHKKHDESE